MAFTYLKVKSAKWLCLLLVVLVLVLLFWSWSKEFGLVYITVLQRNLSYDKLTIRFAKEYTIYIHECDRQTDRQIDGPRPTASTAATHSVAR